MKGVIIIAIALALAGIRLLALAVTGQVRAQRCAVLRA